MGILEIILLIIVFIWLIDLSYSRSKILKFVEASASALEDLGDRIKKLENNQEEESNDSDSDADN